jgi:shikimate kinase
MLLKLKQTPGIYLVGFMGSGKSTVGKVLSDELGWNYYDLDQVVEKAAGASVQEIFDTRGEAEFRKLETAALRKYVNVIKTGHPHVLSLGGGTITIPENFDLAINHGVIVWLDTPLEVIERRIAAETHRPLARDPERMRQLFYERRDIYAKCDYHIETGEDEPLAIVYKILGLPIFVP